MGCAALSVACNFIVACQLSGVGLNKSGVGGNFLQLLWEAEHGGRRAGNFSTRTAHSGTVLRKIRLTYRACCLQHRKTSAAGVLVIMALKWLSPESHSSHLDFLALVTKLSLCISSPTFTFFFLGFAVCYIPCFLFWFFIPSSLEFKGNRLFWDVMNENYFSTLTLDSLGVEF